MPILKKYEIGYKPDNDVNIYYTGYTILAVDKHDALIEYCTLSGRNMNDKNIKINEVD